MPPTVTNIATLNFNEAESILHIEMMPDAEINLEQVKAHYKLIKKITKGKPYVALIDASNYYRMEPEALKYSAEQNTLGNRVAAAHYNCTVANTLTVSFFKKQLKPSIPIGIFKSKEEALTWIEQLKQNGALTSKIAI
jgi:hypothetical protein